MKITSAIIISSFISCAAYAGPQDPRIGDIVGATGTVEKSVTPSGKVTYIFNSDRPITVNVCDKSGKNCREEANHTKFMLATNGTNIDDKLNMHVVMAGKVVEGSRGYGTPIVFEVAMVQAVPKTNG